MKKSLLTVFISLTAILSFAQGNVIFRDIEKNPMGDTVKFIHDIDEAGLPNAFEIEGYISNLSDAQVDIKIRRVVEKYIANCDDQVCWAGQCVAYSYKKLDQTSVSVQSLAAGEDFLLIDDANVVFHFLHNNLVGTTQIKYYLMNGAIVEDSLVAVYTLTGPKVTLTFNVNLSTLDGFTPKSKVYVEGSFGEKTQMVSWDSSTYWVSLPVDLNGSYTYHYIAGTSAETVEHSIAVATSDVATNDNFNVSSITTEQVKDWLSSPSPNPAQNSTQISYHLVKPGKSKLLIMNIIGSKVYMQNLSNTSGSVNINLSSLPNGIYFINLEQNGSVISSHKLVKR